MLKDIEIKRILEFAMSKGNEFAEIFIEDNKINFISILNNKIQNSIIGIERGIGIRLCNGNKEIYSYTNNLSYNNIISIINKMSIYNIYNNIRDIEITKYDYTTKNNIEVRPFNINKSIKQDLLLNISNLALSYDNLVHQVNIEYKDYEQEVIVANSKGTFAKDLRIRTHVMIESRAEKNGISKLGYSGAGAQKGIEFLDSIELKSKAKSACRMAKNLIFAKDIPSGKMDVVLSNGIGGIIFHEACGHLLEANSVIKRKSNILSEIGSKVASTNVTLIDDGTIVNEWGSQCIDDEGTSTSRNILIEKGTLKNYLTDEISSKKLNMNKTGSARRSSYKYAPTARMSNTFLANGVITKKQIISSIEQGIYVKNIGGGSVNPLTGEFNFSITEGYMIKNGQILYPIKGATLIGYGPEVLNKINLIGNDLKLHQTMCNSISGMIPVTVGQPTIKVKEMLVGGRGIKD